MFAYGSQIIEGKDRAQVYIEREKSIVSAPYNNIVIKQTLHISFNTSA